MARKSYGFYINQIEASISHLDEIWADKKRLDSILRVRPLDSDEKDLYDRVMQALSVENSSLGLLFMKLCDYQSSEYGRYLERKRGEKHGK